MVGLGVVGVGAGVRAASDASLERSSVALLVLIEVGVEVAGAVEVGVVGVGV
jgi:hypothetical protein